jgi:hypothetical protein
MEYTAELRVLVGHYLMFSLALATVVGGIIVVKPWRVWREEQR